MSRNTSTLADIGDAVTDAWAATAAFAQDLASGAAHTASDLGAAAGSGLSEGADRVSALYDQARGQIRPQRRRFSPWLIVGAAVVALVGVGWWTRRGRTAGQEPTTSHLSPVAEHAATARTAAG